MLHSAQCSGRQRTYRQAKEDAEELAKSTVALRDAASSQEGH